MCLFHSGGPRLHRKAWPHSLAPLVQNLVNDEIDTAADDDNPQSIGDGRRRMSKADAELKEMSERLQSALRIESPELFDRRRRLRRRALSKRLAERTGRTCLSGDDLLAVEQSADAKPAR